MAVAWTDTPVFRLIDPDAIDEGSDALDDACGDIAGGDDLGGGAGFGSGIGSGAAAGLSSRTPSARDTQPMTGSHIPGVDTGAKGGQTSYIDGNGQLQTIASGSGSFGASGMGMHPIYNQLAGQLARDDGDDTSAGASNDGTSDIAWSDEPLGDTGDYVDFLVSPDENLPGTGLGVDVTLPSFSDDPVANADAQLGVDGQWYTYAHEISLYASSHPPGSVSLDTASIDAANAAYEDAVHAAGSSDYGGKVEAANEAINAMIRANDWSYGPSAPQTLDPVVVNAGPGFGGDGVASGSLGSGAPRFGSGVSPTGDGGDETPTSPLDRIDRQLSDFNDIVGDELVDEGSQALRKGDDAGFVWNGLKYAFYDTFMPKSVEGGIIGVVGGGVAGKALGWVTKLGGRLFGDGIGNLAMAAFSRSGASRALGRALERAGFVRGKGEVSHHLVAWDAPLAAPSRDILENFGIDINEAANGVFLSRAMHSRLHTHAYYDAVYDELLKATSKDDALAILEGIRQRLLKGAFP